MEQNQDSSIFGFSVDHIGRTHLAEAARWAKFLSVVGFIFCAIIILIGLFFGTFINILSGSLQENNPYKDLPVSSTGFGMTMAVLYSLIALIYFFPCLFLFRFAIKMKRALASNDQETLNLAFLNLKSTFRYIGIITIVLLSFWLLAFLIGLLGAAAGGNI